MSYNCGPIALVTYKKIGIKQKHSNKIKATSQGFITIVHTERIINKVFLWLFLAVILMISWNIFCNKFGTKCRSCASSNCWLKNGWIANSDSVCWISDIQWKLRDKEQSRTFHLNQSQHCLFKDNIMTVLLIYMSADLISAVMNLTLKAGKDCTVSWKQVIVMSHPSKGFFFSTELE